MWRAEQLERSFVHLPDDGGIERSTAEVIDRDGGAVPHAGLRGVMSGGRNWLARTTPR